MRRLIVLGRVLVGGAVATANVAARKAESRLHPRVSKTQAVFTSGGCVRDMIGRRTKVFAGFLVGHGASLWIMLANIVLAGSPTTSPSTRRRPSHRELSELILGQ